MNILTLYQDLTHQAPAKASTTKGGEYHGPCPACGGRDRFHVWPEQRDGGTYWCRGCGKAGDLIQFRRDFMGEGFRQAAEAAGREIGTMQPKAPPRPWASARGGRDVPAGHTPERRGAPDVNWIEHASKLVGWAHEQLMGEAGTPVRAWLAARGIDRAGIERFHLGWNPGRRGKDLYRERKSWGLPEERKPDGRAKKLWIPRGLIIPLVVDGDVWRVRIRRPDDALDDDRRRGIKDPKRYYVLPGASSRILVCPGDPRAAVIVETELDAMMIACQAEDLCTAVALGSVAVKPDAECHAAIADAVRILVALDYDDPGAKAMAWWRAHYRQAERWPVIYGKDPGEMVQRGGDLRAWILCGLPPALTIGPSVPCLDGGRSAENQNDKQAAGGTAAESGGDDATGTHAAGTLPDGDDVAGAGDHGGDAGLAPLAAPVEGVVGAMAPAVCELIEILRRHPLGVEVTPTRTRIAVLRDGWHDPAVERRLGQLVFFDPDVDEWLEDRPAGWLTGRNVTL